jgi:sugar transferase (PEP-CTERM/EpsH1 system associated)
MQSSLNKINVMHTVVSLEVGGLEKIVSDTVLGFDKELYNIEVCCFSMLGELSYKLLENNIKVNLLKITTKHYDPFYPLRLSRLLREKKVHLLHMHSGTFFLGTQAAILARTPAMLYTDHGRHLNDPKRLILMDRISSIFVDRIVAVSKELEGYLLNVVQLPRKKISTIINGIDTVRYAPRRKPAHLLKEMGIEENTKVIGTVGRLAQVKDQTSMIEAFAIVNRIIPDSVLLLVGDGPMRFELQQLVVKKNLGNSVVFAGSRMDIPDLLNLLDVFLLTSLSEGTSVSLLEAMASGIPPVVTEVGGNPSIVKNGVSGIIVKPKDIAGIADSITYLLNNKDILTSISQNAISTVKQHYSLNNMIEKYSGIYKELCDNLRNCN